MGMVFLLKKFKLPIEYFNDFLQFSKVRKKFKIKSSKILTAYLL